MDAFEQRLFNSQRCSLFLLKPDAPKTNAFHVKDVVNIEPFLVSHNAPEMVAFSVKDAVNIESFLFDMPHRWQMFCQPRVLFVQVLEKTL